MVDSSYIKAIEEKLDEMNGTIDRGMTDIVSQLGTNLQGQNEIVGSTNMKIDELTRAVKSLNESIGKIAGVISKNK